MGFGSGIEIFDKAVKPLLEKPIDQRKAIKALVEALADKDWDTEGDSWYADHPVVKEVYAEVWPQFYGPDAEEW